MLRGRSPGPRRPEENLKQILGRMEGTARRKVPLWRQRMADPESLMRPYLVKGSLPIPLYVRRWLVTHTALTRRQAMPEEMAAQILTEACHRYYSIYAGTPLYFEQLLCGRFHDGEAGFCERVRAGLRPLGPDDDTIVCVDNGRYAYFFSLNERRDRAPFTEWYRTQWRCRAQKKAVWPVFVLQPGDWPIDPRLLPGSPIALPCLETAKPPKRPR